MSQSIYPQLYVDFLYYFNHENDYYECHEVLEEWWLEEGRDRVIQGLLQVAVGIYHFQNGNQGGAKKMWVAALEKMSEWEQPLWFGIDLEQVKMDTERVLQRLTLGQEINPFQVRIEDPELHQLVTKRKEQKDQG
ncbi:DUF309 domain-containing protein [Hazenella coriacea]|uniref:DUF309 family protein family protein n=1 Tax=Hazenella coriacea TaxID=1179467 RepID=A0A4R3L7M0_9BACL|nr:DUF309 domain-containing protein [Hazenella coriacea]TCS95951.1 hypothetical protein EDD58_102535 [Hazenella coriacea]